MSCQSGISKKLSIISILLRDFLTSFDKIDKKNGLDVAAAVMVVLVLAGQFLTTTTLRLQVHFKVFLLQVFSTSVLNLLMIFIIMLMANWPRRDKRLSTYR